MNDYPQEIEYAQTVALEQEFLTRINKPETELEKWIDNYIVSWWNFNDKLAIAIAFGMLHGRSLYSISNVNIDYKEEWDDLNVLKSIAFDYAYEI